MDSLTHSVLDTATVTISTGLREGDVLAYSAGSAAVLYGSYGSFGTTLPVLRM